MDTLNEKVGYEIDFLPVDSGDKSGDAIALRYGSKDNFKVMIIDGGTKESGQALVDHIEKYYETDYVDYVVNTHPDMDHASGLTVVLEQLRVGELWMHQPWNHSSEIRDLFKDGRITDNSLSQRLKDDLNVAYSLEQIAEKNSIPIYEPFEGKRIGDFIILSPNEDWYLELVPQFDKTPESKVQTESNTVKSIFEKASAIINYIKETWDIETLKEGSTTSAENESSVILYTKINGEKILLTGDAGINALNKAADYAESIGVDISKSSFIQIPHHGGRHNVSPSVLNRIVGPKVSKEIPSTKIGFVSVSKDSKKHPKRVVVNAFIRRGVKVIATRGMTTCQSNNFSPREGWITAETLPFYDDVEE